MKPSSQHALLFVNGTILTMAATGETNLPSTTASATDNASPAANPTALLVMGDKIVACGTQESVQPLTPPQVHTIDLQGCCIVPGFHDSHVHLLYHGLELTQLNFANTKTLEDALQQVAKAAANTPAGTWLLGAGFSAVRWGQTTLNKEDLDRVAPHHPVFLTSQDHHSSWVNSLALQHANLHAGTPDPEHGKIVRAANGEPSGTLLENASTLVQQAIPPLSEAALTQAIAAGTRDLARYGITTVHTMAYEPVRYWQHIASVASQPLPPVSSDPNHNHNDNLAEDMGCAVRVWACIDEALVPQAAAVGLATGQGGQRFRVGGAKFFADGALGSLTAWMLEPYTHTTNTGIPLITPPTAFVEKFTTVIEAGFTPVVHAIGDAANRIVLDALAATRPLWHARRMRPRIEHAQHLHPDDIGHFADLGIIASIQPLHLIEDAPNIRKNLADRVPRAYPYRSLAQAGTRLVMGSDTPVATPGVLAGMAAAVHRMGADGRVLTASEKLTREQALRGYTTNAAYAIGAETYTGKLAPGYDADLAVLSANPLDPATDLTTLSVDGTLLAGRWTYSSMP